VTHLKRHASTCQTLLLLLALLLLLVLVLLLLLLPLLLLVVLVAVVVAVVVLQRRQAVVVVAVATELTHSSNSSSSSQRQWLHKFNAVQLKSNKYNRVKCRSGCALAMMTLLVAAVVVRKGAETLMFKQLKREPGSVLPKLGLTSHSKCHQSTIHNFTGVGDILPVCFIVPHQGLCI
jgi:hypothetical protein